MPQRPPMKRCGDVRPSWWKAMACTLRSWSSSKWLILKLTISRSKTGASFSSRWTTVPFARARLTSGAMSTCSPFFTMTLVNCV